MLYVQNKIPKAQPNPKVSIIASQTLINFSLPHSIANAWFIFIWTTTFKKIIPRHSISRSVLKTAQIELVHKYNFRKVSVDKTCEKCNSKFTHDAPLSTRLVRSFIVSKNHKLINFYCESLIVHVENLNHKMIKFKLYM